MQELQIFLKKEIKNLNFRIYFQGKYQGFKKYESSGYCQKTKKIWQSSRGS